MSYVLSELFLLDFRRHGVKNPERKAAFSAMAAMTLVELGDATSDKFGASGEDLLADAIGVAASWWLATNPVWDNRIDIRMEYWPSNGFNLKNDAVSDYSGMKHLVALRAEGFDMFRHTPLKWLELQAGYYTRGFRTFDEQEVPTRHTYIGLGISLPVLLGKNSIAGKAFSYVQLPGLNVEAVGKTMKKTLKQIRAEKKQKPNFWQMLKKSDVRFLYWYSIFALIVTVVYWINGGKSIFVFPTILCVGLVIRNLRRPVSDYFNNGSRLLPIKHSKGR